MISFFNDYNELAHPRVLENLTKHQAEPNIGYGNDPHYLNAIKYIKKEIGREDIDIHFIHGGTMVNLIAIKAMLQSYQGVISVDTGHIIGHENGAIEATGHQIFQVPPVNGKITVEAIDKALKTNSKEYSVKLKVVYISNASEIGTIYGKNELKEISDFCKKNDLYIYMDGARLGSALASEHTDLTLADLTEYTDIFTIGGTKNGLLMGEAMVIVNREFSKGIRRIIKQRGAMLAKGFLLGMQFETMFKDGLYFSIAKDAVDMAKYLAETFESNGIELAAKQESNLVFALIPADQARELANNFMFEMNETLEDGRVVTRFVTKWSTTKEEIDKLAEALKGFKENN